jgi:poly-gamma-glutamate synthesis protein (capsule biosynthesis protein)
MLALCAMLAAYVLAERRRAPERTQRRYALMWKIDAMGASMGALVGAALIALLSISPSRPPRGPTKTLAFVGDMMFTRGLERDYAKAGVPCDHAFEKVSRYLQEADIAFGNLETALSVGTTSIEKRYTFSSSPSCAAALKNAGFDVLALANNHVLDHAEEGLRQTLDNLKTQGLSPLGLSSDGAPQEPVIVNLGEFKVGYLGYVDPLTPYAFAKEYTVFPVRPAEGTIARISEDIRALKQKVDVVVVSMHWGLEYKSIDPGQRALGEAIVNAGADLVAGHHPHVQQDAHWYKNGLIIYSMGNFVFDQRKREDTSKSRLYRIQMSKYGVERAEYLPLQIKPTDWQPTPDDSGDWVIVDR